MKIRVYVVLSGLFLSACAGSSSGVVKSYELAQPAGAPYSRILVVGAHPDRSVRRQYEETMVEALRAARVDAEPSIRLMNAETEFGREAVVAAAEASRADAVLVSRPRDVRWSATQGEPKSITEARRKEGNNLLDFFRYDYVEYEDPMSAAAVRTVVVASDLYRVSDHTKVWSVESSGVEKETIMDAIKSIATSTRRQLQRDGLVR